MELKEWNRRYDNKGLEAFRDGVFTGLDPLGLLIGYSSKNITFLGYRADKYSILPGSIMDHTNHIASVK